MKLPTTLAELASPEGKAAIREAERLLTALQNLRLRVIVNGRDGVDCPVKFAGESAVVELKIGIGLPTAVANASASTESNTTQLNRLLDGLAAVRINPRG